MSRSKASVALSIMAVAAMLLVNACGSGSRSTPSSTSTGSGGSGGTSGPGGSGGSGASSVATDQQLTTVDYAINLTSPWSLKFAPDGRLFFTERAGHLRVIANGTLVPTPVLDLTSQTVGGEGGTTGMDLDPNFATNHLIYLHYCSAGPAQCQVVRVVVNGNTGTIDKVLLTYPISTGDFDHTGGRLKVGPDNLLYLTTGDHADAPSAQDSTSWNGKILRMNLDGTPAAGNPFPQNPYVYSYGHRDPQGLAWDSSGQLYETEHGPTSNDEVNIIHAGANYGWPNCVGICHNPAYTDPVKLFSPETVPPSGAVFYQGSTIPGWDNTMLFAVLGLVGNTNAHHVHQLKFDTPGGTNVVFEQELWANKFARIRDVTEGPDGFLYFATSNMGGSQTSLAAPNDDRIIQAHP
jgi:aldose sugar dehydrogenase